VVSLKLNYDRLMATRNSGDWESWLRFFLAGVAQTAEEATGTARGILALAKSTVASSRSTPAA
jgi:Fic family protein